MVRAIIFDLDSCLSAADETGRDLFEPAFRAIIKANVGSHGEATLRKAFEDMWRVPYDVVAKQYRFTPEMHAAGWNELRHIEVTGAMRGYEDLSIIRKLGVPCFLVTTGFRRLQESKIRALGIASLFSGVYVDAIDEPGHCGKQVIFERILKDHSFLRAETLVVGDNPGSELVIGLSLGMQTVQTLRPGVPFSASATYHIRRLEELLSIVRDT